jgi:hypothetical protein
MNETKIIATGSCKSLEDMGIKINDEAISISFSGIQTLCPICNEDWYSIKCPHDSFELLEYITILRKQLEKWENWLPDDDDLRVLAEQAKSRDGTYTNGLASQCVYIGALEARLREIRKQLKVAMEALGNTRDYFYVAGEEWREPYRWAIDTLAEIAKIGGTNEM